MYSMKDACKETGMSYETLKFYCNKGLIPNVKRNANNHRVFDEHDIAWIKSLRCLKNCGMSLQEMKAYIDLCFQGTETIPERKSILAQKRNELLERMAEVQASVDFIDGKQKFYDDVLSGKIKHQSNSITANGDA